jgi:hypothetical protein
LRDLEKLQKEFQNYKERVVIEGSKASPAKVDAAIVRLASGNFMLRSNLRGGAPAGIFSNLDLSKDKGEI